MLQSEWHRFDRSGSRRCALAQEAYRDKPSFVEIYLGLRRPVSAQRQKPLFDNFVWNGLMLEDRKRLESLDAVRGVASFVVMWHHIVLGFEPNWKLATSFAMSPLMQIWHHGELAVHVFFVLSGFVLSYSFLKSGNVDVLRVAAVKRYWRLFLPVSVSVFSSYLLLVSHAYSNVEAARLMNQSDSSWLNRWFTFHPSWVSAIKEAVYGTFFNFNIGRTYNPNLWTMRSEFLGSFFIFAFQALTCGLRCRPLIYLVILVVFQQYRQYWMIDFLAGAAICDLFHIKGLRVPLPMLIALLGLLLAATSPEWLNGAIGYRLFPDRISVYLTMVSAVSVVVGVLWSPFLQRLLSTSPLLLLGRMSFPLYLFHLLVECSLGCGTYIYVVRDAGFSHNVGFASASLVTVVVSMMLAWIGSFTIEPQSIRLGRWVYARWFDPHGSRPL